MGGESGTRGADNRGQSAKRSSPLPGRRDKNGTLIFPDVQPFALHCRVFDEVPPSCSRRSISSDELNASRCGRKWRGRTTILGFLKAKPGVIWGRRRPRLCESDGLFIHMTNSSIHLNMKGSGRRGGAGLRVAAAARRRSEEEKKKKRKCLACSLLLLSLSAEAVPGLTPDGWRVCCLKCCAVALGGAAVVYWPVAAVEPQHYLPFAF